MKKTSIIFLQSVIILIGTATFALMIRLPLSEGRAVNLDLFSIYSDPLIIYGYLASIPFFAALYQAFKLLRYIGQNKVFSVSSIKSMRIIKYCATTLGILVFMATLYIATSHNIDDDPAGFIVVSTVVALISIIIAAVAAVFEKVLQNAVDIKSENDLIV